MKQKRNCQNFVGDGLRLSFNFVKLTLEYIFKIRKLYEFLDGHDSTTLRQKYMHN